MLWEEIGEIGQISRGECVCKRELTEKSKEIIFRKFEIEIEHRH